MHVVGGSVCGRLLQLNMVIVILISIILRTNISLSLSRSGFSFILALLGYYPSYATRGGSINEIVTCEYVSISSFPVHFIFSAYR